MTSTYRDSTQLLKFSTQKIRDRPTFLRFVIDRLFIELNYIVDGLLEFCVLAEFPDSSVVPAVDARNAQIGQQGKFGHCRERYSGGYFNGQ